MEVIQLGSCMQSGNRKNPNQGRVYDQNGLSPTLTDMQGGGRQPMIVESKTIVAMRGRNPDNPSDRTSGIPTEQRLEPNSQGICNTLTSVQKDNMVLETRQIGFIDNGTGKHQSNTVYDENGLSPTITTIDGGTQQIKVLKEVCAIDGQNMNIRQETFGTLTTDGSSPKHNNRVMETVRIKQATEQYRIRKLTPNECWRIMDFSDEDFHKAEEVNSNTQLYKQAGNSIVRNVLVAIFGQMIPGKENVYKGEET